MDNKKEKNSLQETKTDKKTNNNDLPHKKKGFIEDNKDTFNNKKYLSISIYALAVIVIAIIFEKSTSNLKAVFSSIGGAFTFLTKMIAPFAYGFAIAYIINPLMKVYEKLIDTISHKFSFTMKDKLKRVIAVILSYLSIIFAFFILFKYLFPELIESGKSLMIMMQDFFDYAEVQLGTISSDSLTSTFEDGLALYNDVFQSSYTATEVYSKALDVLQNIGQNLPRYFGGFITGTMGFAKNIFNIFMGLIVSIYMLLDKENLSAISKRLLYAFIPERMAVAIHATADSTNEIFQAYFVGNLIESAIVGVLFFISSVILKAPIPLLLSIIIGITNIIPYFGPWIGAIPVIFIVLIYDPIKAIWVGISILVVQQIDGLILKPIIFGDSTGLSPLAVTFAILVGGALFGIPGMIFGVPVFAVIKRIIAKWTNIRLDKKEINLEVIEEKQNRKGGGKENET